MDREEFNALMHEVRAAEHDEPPEEISRLRLIAGDVVTIRLLNGVEYAEIEEVSTWRDLLDLAHVNDSNLAGLNVTIQDWSGSDVMLRAAPGVQPEMSKPNDTVLMLRSGILDVFSWRGWTPGTMQSHWMYYSSWRINDPKRVIVLICAGEQIPHQNVEARELPTDQHMRAVRKWAKERYGLTRFEGLRVQE